MQLACGRLAVFRVLKANEKFGSKQKNFQNQTFKSSSRSEMEIAVFKL